MYKTSQNPLLDYAYNTVLKNSLANAEDATAGDTGLILGSGRTPEGNGNPFQYSCLGNPMERGAWKAIVCWVIKSRTPLSD